MKTQLKSAFTGKRILIILAAFIGFNAMAQEPPRYLNVLAVNGLNMRTQPEANARIVTKVAYGQRVEVLELTDVKLQLGWVNDRWYKVRFHGREGYLFGGYLSTMNAPLAILTSTTYRDMLTAYVDGLKQVGGTVETLERTRSDTLKHRLLTYEGGMEMEQEDRAERKVTELLLPTTVEKTLVLLEALLKTTGKGDIIETLRFVQNTDGTLRKVSTADGSIRIQKLNDEVVELRLVDFDQQASGY